MPLDLLAALRGTVDALLEQVDTLTVACLPTSAPAPAVSGGELVRESFGQALRRLRVAAGWSQPVLAARARVSQSMVSKLETGAEAPSHRLAVACEQALDAPGALVTLAAARAAVAPNRRLLSLLHQARCSRKTFAVLVSAHAASTGHPSPVEAGDVAAWLDGTPVPEPAIEHVCAVLSRLLHRPVTPTHAGLTPAATAARQHLHRHHRVRPGQAQEGDLSQ